VVGRDAQEVLFGRISADPAEEHAGFCLPSAQIGTEDQSLLSVRDLGSDPLVASPTEDEGEPAAVSANVAGPLGLASRGHKVLATVEVEKVDRRAPEGTALAAPHLQDTAAPDVDACASQDRNARVEHPLGQPAGLLVVRASSLGHLVFLLSVGPLTDAQFEQLEKLCQRL